MVTFRNKGAPSAPEVMAEKLVLYVPTVTVAVTLVAVLPEVVTLTASVSPLATVQELTQSELLITRVPRLVEALAFTPLPSPLSVIALLVTGELRAWPVAGLKENASGVVPGGAEVVAENVAEFKPTDTVAVTAVLYEPEVVTLTASVSPLSTTQAALQSTPLITRVPLLVVTLALIPEPRPLMFTALLVTGLVSPCSVTAVKLKLDG